VSGRTASFRMAGVVVRRNGRSRSSRLHAIRVIMEGAKLLKFCSERVILSFEFPQFHLGRREVADIFRRQGQSGLKLRDWLLQL